MYAFCDQTVTVYRLEDGCVRRTVLEGCWLQLREEQTETPEGIGLHRHFLLVAPGAVQQVFAGDRVMAGVGPAIAPEQWATFIPAAVPELVQVVYAERFCWNGQLQHVEAGG